MPATALTPVQVARRAIGLQEAVRDLSALARRHPQVKPLVRHAEGLLDELLRSMRPETGSSARSVRLVEAGGDASSASVDEDGLYTAKALSLITDMLQTFRGPAIDGLDLAFRTGKTSSLQKSSDVFARTKQVIDRWLDADAGANSIARDELDRLAEIVTTKLRGPVNAGSADQLQAATDDLLAMFEHAARLAAELSGPTEGEAQSAEFRSEIAAIERLPASEFTTESLFSRWAASPPTDEALRGFAKRYLL